MDYTALTAHNQTDYTDVNRYNHMTQSAASITPALAEESIAVENKFGSFLFTPDKFITFRQGLIGMTEFTRFAIASIPSAEEKNNFRLLQSLEQSSLSFIVFPTTANNSLLEHQDVAALCSSFAIAEENLLLLHIVTLREMFGKTQMTLNVKAPIIIDSANRTAVQYVLPSSKYDVQVPLAA